MQKQLCPVSDPKWLKMQSFQQQITGNNIQKMLKYYNITATRTIYDQVAQKGGKVR